MDALCSNVGATGIREREREMDKSRSRDIHNKANNS
jgi:hypothetical protein